MLRHLLAAVACLLLAVPGAAHASPNQEAVFMDDTEFVFGSDEEVEATFAVLDSLGVDRVRSLLLWELVAPAAGSQTRPAFGAGGPTDPAAYPADAWNIYDRLVNAAERHGMEVLFTITGPGPVWASSDPGRGDRVWDPNPADFRDFATAVGRRYSGGYTDEQPVQAPPPGGLPILGPPEPPPGPPPTVLPRVSLWSIWNEPNQPGWLRPQTIDGVPASPRIYRALQDAGYAGLQAAGHGSGSYLLGETAPRGSLTVEEYSPMRPLLFVRELYCVNRKLRFLEGAAAQARGCPTDAAGRSSFTSDHPGLFRAGGFAHHPYALEVAPSRPDPIPDQVTLGVLTRLPKALDRIFLRWGVRRKLPLWLTEYGYQTNPPDPIVGVSWKRQAAWINEAEFIAYRSRRVRAMTQFLLVDDAPDADYPPDDVRYWGATFQSGLVTLEGTRKDAFEAYKLPVHVRPRRVRRGKRVRLYGANRPARDGATLPVAVEFRRRGGKRWRTVKRLTTRNRRGYVVVKLRPAASGSYRLAWESGRSRSVSVSVRG
jgi:hypothetical protein